MTQTIGQLPRCNPPRPKRNVDALIGATLLFVFASFPRLFILAFWIFGSELGDAFGSWIIPAVGFIVAPWTTLLYAWMWAISSDAVAGWEWIVVAVGVLLDLAFLVMVRRLMR